MNLKKIRKRTAYGADKINKAGNFEFLNRNYCKKGQTVLVGDSITEMYNHTEMFAAYTAETGISVYNRGISGDTSDRLLERLESNVLSLEPRNMVLLIGTNDLGVGADVDFAAQNVEKIIAASKQACKDVNIILEAVYPISCKGRRKNKDILALNSRLCEIAERYGTHFVDLTAQLADAEGKLSKEYTFDGLHVNARAYEMITKAILPLLK